jgi:hypothetical protein
MEMEGAQEPTHIGILGRKQIGTKVVEGDIATRNNNER